MENYIQNLSLTKDVILKDLNGGDCTVVKCYCNINNSSMNMTIDIIDRQKFEANLENCRVQISEFRAYCEQKAIENGITIF